MNIKKYQFKKILDEYNKLYKQSYESPPETYNIVIVHELETKHFLVNYTNKDESSKSTKTLHSFLRCDISENISESYFQNIMISKEENCLNLKIEIWPPSKIRYAYLHTNYFANGVGHLGKSCMRGKDMQKSLNFYIKNNVRIVVLIDNMNKIHARALLWDDVRYTRFKKAFTYLDRVYTKSEASFSLFKKLTDENKWKYYKSTSAGNAKSDLYVANLDITDITHLPYADTFRYLYYKDNLVASSSISSAIAKHHNKYLSLTQVTNGGYFPELDSNRVVEVITNNFISKKDAIFVKRYDGYVLKVNIANIEGDYYSIHDRDIIETNIDGWILRKNSIDEVITNDKINKSLAVYSSKYNGYIHKSNMVDIKGKIYHKKDANVIFFDANWYHISQCFINYDRKEYNKELAKQSIFFYPNLPETWVFHATVTRKGSLIPKKHAIIAYDLAYNSGLDIIEYQEVYCTNYDKLVQLTTGEWVVNSANNKQYLKRFNNKWYIRREFKLPDKNQLLLFG